MGTGSAATRERGASKIDERRGTSQKPPSGQVPIGAYGTNPAQRRLWHREHLTLGQGRCALAGQGRGVECPIQQRSP